MHAVLIEHTDGLICWDTGAPRDWKARWAGTTLDEGNPYEYVEEGEYFEDRLTQLGFGPSDVKVVALSHLHCDHVGNLSKFDGLGTRLVVHEREYDAAMGISGEWSGPYVKADYASYKFETVAGDVELMPGVQLLETPGHTPGSMSLRVETRGAGVLLFVADAIYMHDAYRPVAKVPGIVWSEEMWRKSVERIRLVEEGEDALVVFGHDAAQLGRLRLAPASYYE
jgi:glyoxylase-like metal-dependent hydrolase (beta-lactamase superfamily II)